MATGPNKRVNKAAGQTKAKKKTTKKKRSGPEGVERTTELKAGSSQPFATRPDLPIQWFDFMRMTRRLGPTGGGAEGIVIFSFSHILPEPTSELAGIEIVRVATSAAHVKKMIDVMCKSMDYFPQPGAEE